MLKLDQVQSVALAGLVLFLGYAVRRRAAFLDRYNLPAPVIGGLIVAIVITVLRGQGLTLLQLDTALQPALMIAFFTSVGFGASLSLLRTGGPAVLFFLVLSTLAAIGQNLVGAGIAAALGQHPLMGVLAGSVTLTGGPATGLAFAPLFEKAGVPGAATLAVAAAMAGIVAGGLIGGPIGTWLVEKGELKPGRHRSSTAPPMLEEQAVLRPAGEPPWADPEGDEAQSYGLMKGLVAILAAMWAGYWLSRGFEALGWTLPAYIGAMLAAAVLRNLDDATRLLRLSQVVIDDLGTVALSLFLAMALMTLKLWELAGLALPLTLILMAQVGLIAVLCLGLVPRLMGRDYDAAIMSSGFAGFMLGTTANAMANMGTLVERYGPAPRAYLVVPMVGAFFIDFTNALLITACLNLWG